MRIVFNMPAPAQAAFEAFHHHSIRMRWDTLLAEAYVEGGGDHPYVDAITFNRGKGWKGGMSMRTRFVSYEPPRLAAAVMIEPSGLFGEWAASMKHRDLVNGCSELVYSFNLRLRPRWLLEPFDWIAIRIFAWQTRKRFRAMANYLAASGRTTALTPR